MIAFQDLKISNAPITDACIEAAVRVLRSGRYINGPELRRMEQTIEDLTGAAYCVGTSTGLDALRLILTGYKEMDKLKEGDEVIVPANTFIATFLAVTHCGLTPVAADANESTACIDFNKLPISPRTRAIIPVHLYGRICWNAEILSSLRRQGILIIEDNAQAIGATITLKEFSGTRAAANLGDAAAISFYPAKNIGAFGDAGAVVTNDKGLAETVRKLANYGSSTKYIHEICGFNCRMDEIQAAILCEKLAFIGETNARRRRNATLYDKLITNPDVVKPNMPENPEEHVWHQYVIRHPRRDDLREYLQSNGIATEIHYPVACHLQPCYQGDKPIKAYGPLPVAERLAAEVVSLPIAHATEEEIHTVAEAINNFNLKNTPVKK